MSIIHPIGGHRRTRRGSLRPWPWLLSAEGVVRLYRGKSLAVDGGLTARSYSVMILTRNFCPTYRSVPRLGRVPARSKGPARPATTERHRPNAQGSISQQFSKVLQAGGGHQRQALNSPVPSFDEARPGSTIDRMPSPRNLRKRRRFRRVWAILTPPIS